MMSVELLYEQDPRGRPHGCGDIRLLRPFGRAAAEGRVQVRAAPHLGDEATTVVVVERSWRPIIDGQIALTLVEEIRRRNSLLVYTLDDNLLDLHVEEPWRRVVCESHRMAVRAFARQADLVVTSTERLAERLRPLNPRVDVVPNTLDLSLWRPAPLVEAPGSRREPLVIGYMGTVSHHGDLMMVVQALREVLRRHRGAVRFELVGVSRHESLPQLFRGLPFRALDPGERYRYEEFVAWAREKVRWDIGIAPLAPVPFNEFKSDIKFLDYAALGLPGLYSRRTPYSATVEDGVTGLLVGDEPEDWVEALERLIADGDLRLRLARAARAFLCTHRTVRQGADAWVKSIEDALHAGGRRGEW